VFELSQKDLHILIKIKVYFKIGSLYTNTKGMRRYRLYIKDKKISTLIPYFNNYSLVV
jgi:hypothetical protein